MKNYTQNGLFLIFIGMIIGMIGSIVLAGYFFVNTSEPSNMFGYTGISLIGGLGGLLILIGELLFFIGRKEFGERHQKFVIYALIIIILSIVSITIVTSASVFFYVSSSMNGDSLEMMGVLSPVLFFSTIISAITSGLVYIFALYNLENEIGRKILYIAFVISVVISVGIYGLTVNELSELVKSYSLESSYTTVTSSFSYLSLMTKYAILGVFSQVLWAIAVYIPYKRMKDGELVPINILLGKGIETTSDRICPNCQRGIPTDANVCPYCGKRFENYL